MRLFRSALCALALPLASATQGLAADGTRVAGDGSCEMLCEIQAYLNRDHMVTMAPATGQLARPIVKVVGQDVKAAPRRTVVVHAEPRKVTRKMLVATMEPAPRRRSVAPHRTQLAQSLRVPPQSVPAPAPAPAPATHLPAIIPGSVPLVTPQFAPSSL